MIIKYARSVNDIINEVGLLNASTITYNYSIVIKVKDTMKTKQKLCWPKNDINELWHYAVGHE